MAFERIFFTRFGVSVHIPKIFLCMMFQCEQVEAELATNLQLQRANLHRLIDILHTYSTIVAQVRGTLLSSSVVRKRLHHPKCPDVNGSDPIHNEAHAGLFWFMCTRRQEDLTNL